MWGEMKKLLIALLILMVAVVAWAHQNMVNRPDVLYLGDEVQVFDTLPDKWMIDSMTFTGVTITWRDGLSFDLTTLSKGCMGATKSISS